MTMLFNVDTLVEFGNIRRVFFLKKKTTKLLIELQWEYITCKKSKY